VRGDGSGDHVFLYRNAPLSKDLIRSRLKTIGKRVGVKVYPHRLRHTTATQLLNAGCRITSIQAFLGHKKLNTTLIYARAYDQTVAEDYFAAMSRVEQRMEIASVPKPEPETKDEVVKHTIEKK
jgi:site-specific recombinase XerD